MLYQALNEKETEIYESMLAELRVGVDPALDSVLWRLHYIQQPVHLEQFLNDSYYLGETWRPSEDNPGMWPEWRKTLCEDFDLDSKIHNLVITGSLGIGKTAVLTTLLLYRVYIATLLKNPQHFFGIAKGSDIFYAILSVTKEAVKDTAFGYAMNYMAQSAYFTERCGYDPELHYSNYRIPILNQLPSGKPSLLKIVAGSRSQHALGRNVIGVGMDEGNFRLEKNPDMTAYALYDTLRTRIANRFQKVAGFLPALSVIASSASDESSFTEKVISEIHQANSPHTEKVYRHAIYRIKRHDLKLLPWWFRVAYGLKNMEPFILEGYYNEDGSPIPVGTVVQKGSGETMVCTKHEEPPPGTHTELVPGDHWEAYRRNCRAQLQNLSGISTGGSHRLFPSTVDVEWCIAKSADEGVPDPMQKNVDMFPISSEDKKNIWDYLHHKSFLTMVSSKIQPIRHPGNLRYAHLDLATQTMAGLSVCHLVGQQLIKGLVKDGEPFEEYRLVVEYDFILTITAGHEKPINLEKIQRFFFWLRDMCGYRFGKITADMFQCLTSDTLVDTDRGVLPISEVTQGDSVQDFQGKKAVVTGNFRYTNAPVIRITTDKGETVRGTPNHRIMAANHCKHSATIPVYTWTELGSLKLGDVVQMVNTPVCVEGGVPESKAEWLGVYWGSGCVKKNVSVVLSCAKDNVQSVVGLSMRTLGIKPRIYWSRDFNGAEIVLHSKNLVKWLASNGYLKARKTKADIGMPAAILKCSRSALADFLKGLFASTGKVSENGAVSLTTKYHRLAVDVQTVLRTQFGLKSNVMGRKSRFHRRQSARWTIQLCCSATSFFDVIGLSLNQRPVKPKGRTSKKTQHSVSRVASIQHGFDDVFDLQVEGTHSYTANGFVSHNSEAPLQALEAKGFEVGKLSIDRDKTAYTAWRMGFEERRIRLYRSQQMLREAEALLEMDKKFDHPPDGCFTGDTRLALADGTAPTFEEAAKRFPNGQPFEVFSMSSSGLCLGMARNPRITRRAAGLIELTLGNSQTIRCTPDHLFMTLEFGWIKAEDLTPNVCLMPFLASDIASSAWCPVHRNYVHARRIAERERPWLPKNIGMFRASGNKSCNVTAVRLIAETCDVWDVTVDHLHNFALASGVFAHNSKDTTDAAAGAYFNAVNSAEKVMLVSHNDAVMATNQGIDRTLEDNRPPIEIVLPSRGYNRSKVFVG